MKLLGGSSAVVVTRWPHPGDDEVVAASPH